MFFFKSAGFALLLDVAIVVIYTICIAYYIFVAKNTYLWKSFQRNKLIFQLTQSLI